MGKEIKMYLGIDWGEKRIGLATGDSETKIAIPYNVVADLSGVLQVINKEEIDCLVIGEPVKMSGDNKTMTEGFIDFVSTLKTKVKIPVELIDERLTSKAADALIGTKKTKAERDALAAMLILQTYFDRNGRDV